MVATASTRTVSKAQRREQLIRATMKCVARNGLSATTMAEVTKEAGLSLGIVNLHFQSKEKLLVETLRYVAAEYQAEWHRAVSIDGSPAERLANLIEVDFSAKVCRREKLAVHKYGLAYRHTGNRPYRSHVSSCRGKDRR